MSLVCAEDFQLAPAIASRCLRILRARSAETLDSIPYAEIHDELKATTRTLLSDAGVWQVLGDDSRGLASFSFPLEEELDFRDNLLMNTAMFSLVIAGLFDPAEESGVPFHLYKSTVENTGVMKKAGVKFYTPDQKLGYHNDVFVESGRYHIPKFVGLINLFIGYDRPGNFYYVNNHIWTRFEEVFARGVGKAFKFRPTPSLLETDLPKYADESIPPPERAWIDTPAFWRDESGQKRAFCNGELADADGDEPGVIGLMKSSLIENAAKYFTPQEVGRMTVFRNDCGYHSRDLFQDQRVKSGTTRLFLRAVSREALRIPSLDDTLVS